MLSDLGGVAGGGRRFAAAAESAGASFDPWNGTRPADEPAAESAPGPLDGRTGVLLG